MWPLPMTASGHMSANNSDDSIATIDTDPSSPTFNTVIGAPILLEKDFFPSKIVITSAPSKTFLPDHYLAYKAERSRYSPWFRPRLVTLSDQFDEGARFFVTAPVELLNPADKNGEGVSDAESHLVAYGLWPRWGTPKHQKQTSVKVEN